MSEAFLASLTDPDAAAERTLPVERFSPSSIEGFWKCPEQWRRERIAKEPRFSTADLIFGSAFHKAAEHNFTQKMESHEDLPAEEMRDVAGDSFNTVVKDTTDAAEEIRWYTDKPKDVQEGVIAAMVGVGSAPGYLQVLAPTVQPVAVERWVEVDTAIGVPLVAKIDVETDTLAIRDLKTGKKSRRQEDLDSNIQATANLWLREQEGNMASEFGWHVSIKTKVPQQQELITQRSYNEMRQFEQLLVVTANSIHDNMERYGPDGPWPGTSPMAWWCSVTQCSFWGQCAWRGGAK